MAQTRLTEKLQRPVCAVGGAGPLPGAQSKWGHWSVIIKSEDNFQGSRMVKHLFTESQTTADVSGPPHRADSKGTISTFSEIRGPGHLRAMPGRCKGVWSMEPLGRRGGSIPPAIESAGARGSAQ